MGQGAQREHTPVISVSGSASMEVPADEVRISVGVVSEGQEPRKVIDENSQRVSRVMDALMRAGLEDGDVSTGRFSIQPIYTNPGRDRGGRPEIAGYRVQNSLIVETGNLEIAGAIVQAAVEAGANNIDSVSFQLADPRASRAAVLEQAVSYARADAEAVARASGVRLGGIHSLSIGRADFPRPMMGRDARMMNMAEAGAVAPPMSPGEIQVSATVTIEYEIAQ